MTEPERQRILVETVRRFGRQEWFRDAIVYDAHPTTGEPTLEFKVNYVPIFERKSVMDFAMEQGGLVHRFTIVDKAGNPVE